MNFSKILRQNNIFEIVGQCADELELETFVVGGFVRDLILKRPSKDIDFVCVGNGISLAKMVAGKLGSAKVSYFKNFGTAMIKVDNWELEFVGARKESYRRDSRKPIVENGTLQDDQNRRDFTINAMAIGLNTSNFGKLIDPFDGVNDLKLKLVKTPLDPMITFSDDPLRIMRAVRFAAQLGFDIEGDTFEAITGTTERLSIISQERITEELNKIVLSPTPSYGFKLLYHAGILEKVLPELVALKGVDTINNQSHKDNFYHTLQVLDNVAKVSDDLWLRWAAILHDIAKPKTKRFNKKVGWTFHGHEDQGARMVPGIFKKLRLPLNEPMRFVQNLVLLHLRPISLVNESVTDSAIRRLIFEAGDDLEALMTLCRADVTSKNLAKAKKFLNNFDKVEKKMQEVESKDKIKNFQPIITGEIIMETFNLKPSKLIGEIKETIKEAILDGKISNTREDAFPFLLQLGHEKGLKAVIKDLS
ncbi:HD domain-containing protein [Fulvivirgaceae bacterium BMA12]|uniref:HD domain-containing protein n=1 Tax=Agaribacillus aureus TaxID=3051825 RepID=A0ABT8L8R5_9BACT|nr:HD domain-containing protein [Fulvivirgaceae bacterium BMA12]